MSKPSSAGLLARTSPACREPARPSSNQRKLALAVMVALVLFVSTACTAPATANGSDDVVAVVMFVSVIAGIALLSAIGRMIMQLFRVMAMAAAALARLGLFVAVVAGIISVALVASR